MFTQHISDFVILCPTPYSNQVSSMLRPSMLEMEDCSSECMDSRMPSGSKPHLFLTKTHGLSLLTILQRSQASTPSLYAGLEYTCLALHSPCTLEGDRVSTVHSSSDFLFLFEPTFFQILSCQSLASFTSCPCFVCIHGVGDQ